MVVMLGSTASKVDGRGAGWRRSEGDWRRRGVLMVLVVGIKRRGQGRGEQEARSGKVGKEQ
jgi:hypothetical protein